MLWKVHHLCPSVACFVLKCYRPNYYLVLRNRDGTANIIQSREGVAQKDYHWI